MYKKLICPWQMQARLKQVQEGINFCIPAHPEVAPGSKCRVIGEPSLLVEVRNEVYCPAIPAQSAVRN
jgi:hypothetical protein